MGILTKYGRMKRVDTQNPNSKDIIASHVLPDPQGK